MENTQNADFEARISRLESLVTSISREIATPLLNLKQPNTTIGASIIAKLSSITDNITELQQQVADTVKDAEEYRINPEELALKLRGYSDGYQIPATAVRDTSRGWREIIAMLRKRATEHIAKSHLSKINVTVVRKGKFIYFVKGADHEL